MFLTIAATATMMASSAYAQSSKDSVRMYNLNEFEITELRRVPLKLSKLPVPLSKLPLSISTVNGNELMNRGIYDIETATKFIPGANIRTTYGAFQQLSVRGFDYAPIHIDGMRDERTTFNSYPIPDLSNVESIQVLKGPAGVLFGHSAVGGAMNIVRKSATGKDETLARIALGSFGYRQSTFAKGGKLVGPVNYYTSLNYSNQDGYRKVNDSRLSWYGVLHAQWGRSDLDLRANLYHDFYATDAGLAPMLRDTVYNADGSTFLNPYTLNPFIKDINSRYNNESDFMYNSGASLNAKYNYRFSDTFTLTDALIVSHDDIDYFSTEELSYPTSDTAGPEFAHYYMTKNGKKYVDLTHVKLSFPLRFSHIANSYQNQLDLNAQFGTDAWKHNMLFGYAVSYMRRTSFSGYSVQGYNPDKFTFPGSPDVYGPGVQSLVDVSEPGSMGYMRERFSKASPSHMLTNGLYIQDLMEVGDKLQVLLALRYDHYTLMGTSVKVIDRTRKFNDPGLDAYNKNISQALTYRAGAVYQALEGWQLYGSVSSFFKPDRSYYNPLVIYVNNKGKEFTPQKNGSIFDPLSGFQTEIGTRIDISKKAVINASVFYINQHNGKKTLGTEKRMIDNKEVEMKIVGQVGTITSKGFEIEGTVFPVRGLMLTAGYGYTDIRYTKLAKNPYLDQNAEEGNPLNNVPKHNFYSYGSYQVGGGCLKGLGLNYSMTYTGKIYRDYSRDVSYPGYFLFNAGLSLKIAKNVTARLQVDNIFNTSVFNRSLGLQPMPIKPRSVNFSITYHLK